MKVSVSVIVAVQLVALATLVRGDVNTKMQNLKNKMPRGAAAQMQDMMKTIPACALEKMNAPCNTFHNCTETGGGAGGMKDKVSGIMMMLDGNCDGKLTKEEFEKGVEKMSKMPGGKKAPPSVGWNQMIKIADQPDCDGVLSKEEFGHFIKTDPTQKAGDDGKLSEEEFLMGSLGDEETWKTLKASGKIKNSQISVKDYIAYKVTAAKCNAASLTAALSMLGYVLMAKILF